MIALFAVTTRGLESISSAEMARLPGLQVSQASYRRVSAAYTGEPAALLGLRTVDDIFLDLARWEGIAPQRSELAHLTRLAAELQLRPALETVAHLRPLAHPPTFSVTANFVGKRNYSVDEIKEALANGITAAYDWPYAPEDESEINIRLFIEHDIAYAGMRLAATALHRRPYKQTNLPGSLKPPIAAAMLHLAGAPFGAPPSGETLLDPLCGAGTILIEAALSNARVIGGDNDPLALAAARANASLAGVIAPVLPWDARRLPLDAHSMTRVVTNLPWGRQVAVGEDIAAFYAQVCAEISRVLIPGGQVVALTSLPHLLQFDHFNRLDPIEISLFGQLPSILHLAAA
jgi:23S rRNA G2445 N2-methylase RlmL